ncbi:RNA 2',3'-cyclic phosphodiesterase [Lysobacter sp.]|uniref:RNA 2',3'-cyclic phosphodiesterase n=1 Tax=Lysobacter sp. TaxID=72226 RepID=UPI002D3681A5|nr:RNA 2',3'-cyclic phosphodiesterase [Lysobacter sp.]HZX77777.1 RNA 2',3'-cyclic phosphodiesterase [Lysobacter sp.]
MEQMGLGFAAPKADSMHRLFFALWPDDALRARIDDTATTLEREHAPGGRRLRADRYHVTLQFLGDFKPLPDGLLDRVRTAAANVRSPSFALELDRAGSFRGSNVWWLGSHEAPSALKSLWDELGRALLKQGIRPRSTGGFVPHLTIQRDVRHHLPPTPVEALHWDVREFVLIDSRPGQPYRIEGRWPLE